MAKKQKKQESEITYKDPPLIEVVCGIQFEAVVELNVGHLGKLWSNEYKAYPECYELMPLVTMLEPLPDIPLPNFSMSPTLMPRCCFVAEEDGAIIQIQRDAFYYNWRKKKNDTLDYPRYGTVMERFYSEFNLFNNFIKSLSGSIKPLQFELTYLNEIPITKDYEGKELLRDVRWSGTEERYLPSPELMNFECTFLIPECNGRLRNQFKNIINKDGAHVFQWGLTFRGATKPRDEMTIDKMGSWFDDAHNVIVHAFADLADKQFQDEIWKRVYEK
jgi:uncharacterized protein (TIGR04255 family)